MTDNEIIKALEDYKNSNIIQTENGVISVGDILDIINRQKAEIERLKLLLAQEEKSTISLTKKIYKEAKSEARKEFAERLEEEQIFYEDECGDFVGFISVKRIDNLLAEMEGQE